MLIDNGSSFGCTVCMQHDFSSFAHNNLCSISTSFASQHKYYEYIGLRNQQFKLAILQIAPSTRISYHLFTHWFKFKKKYFKTFLAKTTKHRGSRNEKKKDTK